MAQVRSVNLVIITGRVGTIYPRQKTMRNGKPGPLNISVSTQEIYRNDKTRQDWHKITFWGSNADFAEKFLSVGALVSIEGKLRTTQKKNSDGSISSYVNIEGQQLTLLISGKRGEERAQEEGGGEDYGDPAPEDTPPDDRPADDPDDDIPF